MPGRRELVATIRGIAFRGIPSLCLLLTAGCSSRPPQVIKAGYGNAAPMMSRDAQGHPQGFAVDVLEEAARREGVRVEWVLPTVPVNEALGNGSLDVVLAGVDTPERRSRFYVSAPWWSIDMEALVDARGPLRSEAQLAGRRLAANTGGLAVARGLKPGLIVQRESAPASVAAVCSKDADAAVVAAMYVREILAAMPGVCRDVAIGSIPLTQRHELVMLARPAVAPLAGKLRKRLDDIGLDGTLMKLALRNPPVSAPQAARTMELARTNYQRRLWGLAVLASAGLIALLTGFLLWQQRARGRLHRAYVALEKSAAERVEAMVALRESELRFRTVVETAFDWVWEIDAAGRYTFASSQVEILLGYTPAEILGRTPFDLMPAEEADRVRAEFTALAAARLPLRALENTNLRKDGTAVVLETSGMPILGADGTLLGYCGMDRDISGRKRQERQHAAQAAASRALAEGTGLAEKLHGVLAALAGLVQARTGAAWYAEAGDHQLRSVGVWSEPARDGSLGAVAPCELEQAPPDCVAQRLWAGGQPDLVDFSLCRGPSCLARMAQGHGLCWALGIPLRSENRTCGLILLYCEARPELDEPLSQMLAAVGSLCGEVLERERTRDEMRRFVASSPTVIYALKVAGAGYTPFFVSENLTELTGYGIAEALSSGWWLNNIHPDDRERVLAANAAPCTARLQHLEFRFRRKDGRYIWLRDVKRMLGEDGSEIVGSWSDISQRVELERQLRQSQKMEAIGALAAGVAHDFNNLLTVINGYSTLIHSSLPPGHEAAEQVREVISAGERAAGLTRQLLAFSRRQELQPRVVVLSAIVADLEKLLRRLISEDIQLTIRNRSSAQVLADPGQIEQVLMNLVVNARDAMPEGGDLTVSTSDRAVGEDVPGLAPGPYVELTVSDTGTGIDSETVSRIFDPFFTTKEPGKGTGLGLATVYGIVHQSGGIIQVESRPGHGSVFRVLLRQTVGGPPTAPAPADPGFRGSEVILLVEDDAAVRQVAREALRSRGYRVLEAANAGDALLISDQRPPGEIALLLSDVVMPRVNGIDLAERIRAGRPDIRILFMTGYTDVRLRDRAARLADAEWLQKPFPPMDLARKVREMLDGARA